MGRCGLLVVHGRRSLGHQISEFVPDWSLTLHSKYWIHPGMVGPEKMKSVCAFLLRISLQSGHSISISLSQIRWLMDWLVIVWRIWCRLQIIISVKKNTQSFQDRKHRTLVGLLFPWRGETQGANSKEEHPWSHYSIIRFWHEVKSKNYFKNTLISP